MKQLRKLTYCFWVVAIIVFSQCSNPNDEPAKAKVPVPNDPSVTDTPEGRAKPGTSFPSYNTSPLPPNQTGMTSNAVQIAAQIRLGWNLGNTLEAIGGETAWGNPLTTQALIDKVKASGFNAVRIPCSWDQYADARTAKIQDAWLNRVQQVVQYCINDGLYVILNIHWDGGWLDGHINTRDQAAVNVK
jgi:aryl-phospho-beta-D-glucosidase BglC (GH1 family)